jgi:hypothetical protein
VSGGYGREIPRRIAMLNRKIAAAFTLVALSLVPGVSFAEGSNGAPCVFRQHHVTSVKPYEVERNYSHVTLKSLRGAELYVQAEPGLTAEWLRLQLGRMIVEMRGAAMKDCPLDGNDVRVQVDSQGAGFSVKLIAADANKAAEVLRRARLLQG